jgi:hypothetical protein
MVNELYSKKISFEVVSKGRKYFKIRYSENHKEFQLLINDLSRDFAPGQKISDLLCLFDYKQGFRGHGKTTAIPINKEDLLKKEAERQQAQKESEIERWAGYVESKFNEGRIYQKGLDELKELGFDLSVYKERIEEIREKNRKSEIERWAGYVESTFNEGRIYQKGLDELKELGFDLSVYKERIEEIREKNRKSEIERWAGYVESTFNEGRIYQKGLDELKELGFDLSVYKERIEEIREKNRKSEIERWAGYCREAALEGRDYQKGLAVLKFELDAKSVAEEIEDLAQQVREQRRLAEVERDKEQGIKSYFFCYPSWDAEEQKTHLQIGDLYFDRKEQAWYKIQTRRYERIYEDGLSFGLSDDRGETITGKAILATPEEAEPYIKRQKEQEEEKARKIAYNKEKKAIKDYILDHPERSNPPHNCAKVRLLDASDIYGGGDWFEIDREKGEIWYCKNNGRDGDDWSYNNVSTWGAGAIGVRIPFEQEIALRIETLAREKD